VAAFEVQVLSYRVVEKPHRGRRVADLRAALYVAARTESAR
jgi:hypothetical protein